MKRIFLPATFAVAFLVGCAPQQPQSIVAEYETPTMGWSSWNTFALQISDSIIMQQADAIVALGLDTVGYRYVNIDDGYFGGRDPQTGRLLIHPERFPQGLQPVVDHIHGLGLKAGIYSDAGTNTCGNFWGHDSIADGVGLYGHDQQDCDMFFGEMGFDFIKVDFCGGTSWSNNYYYGLDEQERYTQISQAMQRTGRRDLRLNVCRWDYPGTWVNQVASSWRISGDINCSWRSVRDIVAQSLYLSAYCSPGHYNDMDMLEVGRTLTPEEDRTHFALWCMLSSPLLIGCDVRTLNEESLELLKNRELLALNQDTLGLQAYVARNLGDGAYALVKDVETRQGLTRAVALYNSYDEDRELSVSYADLDLEGPVEVRDLFAHQPIAMPADGVVAKVPAHGTRVYRLSAARRLERRLYEAETAFLTQYQELKNPLAMGTAYYQPDEQCSGGVKAVNLGLRPSNDLRWRDVYCAEGGSRQATIRIAPTPEALQPAERDANEGGYQFYLSVNGGPAQRLRLAADETEVTVTIDLRAGRNEVRLYDDRRLMPGIDCMLIEP